MNDTDYESLIQQISSLINGETDMIANMANISAVLFNSLDNVNWAGFYLFKEEQLVLGPFQGKPACIRIPIGKGVCGVAAATRSVQVVKNVHDFEGHIACDSASNSEIVIPIIANNELIGVLDIDSPEYERFSEYDHQYLAKVVDILVDTLLMCNE